MTAEEVVVCIGIDVVERKKERLTMANVDGFVGWRGSRPLTKHVCISMDDHPPTHI